MNKEQITKKFEANMLDGDTVKDCGGCMIFAEECLDYTIEELSEQRKEIIERIKQVSEKVQGGGNGRRILLQLIGELEETT